MAKTSYHTPKGKREDLHFLLHLLYNLANSWRLQHNFGECKLDMPLKYQRHLMYNMALLSKSTQHWLAVYIIKIECRMLWYQYHKIKLPFWHRDMFTVLALTSADLFWLGYFRFRLWAGTEFFHHLQLVTSAKKKLFAPHPLGPREVTTKLFVTIWMKTSPSFRLAWLIWWLLNSVLCLLGMKHYVKVVKGREMNNVEVNLLLGPEQSFSIFFSWQASLKFNIWLNEPHVETQGQ